MPFYDMITTSQLIDIALLNTHGAPQSVLAFACPNTHFTCPTQKQHINMEKSCA